MISLDELKQVADESGTDVAVVEKDYVLSWALKGIFDSGLSERLVFKGGTALRKVYFEDYRYSQDLDFTIAKSVVIENLKSEIEEICKQAYAQSGLELALAGLKQTGSGMDREAFEGKIQYVGPRRHRGNPSRIRLDITAYEQIILPAADLPLIHGYSDRCSVQIPTYQLEEILAEKFRTIIQRGYPRDLYDTWFILKFHRNRVDFDLAKATYLRKCRFKNVRPVDWREFFKSPAILNKEAAFVNSLGRQLKELPAYFELLADLTKALTDLGMSQSS